MSPRPTRSRHAVLLAAGVALVLTGLPAAVAGPAGARTAGPRTAAARAAADPGAVAALRAAAADPRSAPADVGLTTLGRAGWQVRSSADVTAPPQEVSRPGHADRGWLPVRPDDAGAPGTEIAALLQNGACPHVFYSDTMKRCFGTQTLGRETVARFAVPWWYRTDFATPAGHRRATLVLNGVIGTADVWVNGHRVATHHTVQGAYTSYRVDVTGELAPRTNTLAVLVHPNNPLKMFTVDDVDWSQVPPDQNTGIQFPVQLQTSTTLALSDAHVTQHDAADLSRAALTVSGRVTNATGEAQHGTVSALVLPPKGTGAPVFVSEGVTVPAGTTRTVTLSPAEHPSLTLHHPQVWWPYRMGRQPLYTLVTALDAGGRLVGSSTQHFGVRTVTSSLVGAAPLAPQGVRQYAVNGRTIVVRGGGFDPDLFLRYSAADTAHQIALLKSMGLNTIRLEGHFMPEDFYDQMDRAGILVASGYQCCDAWQLDPDKPLSAKQRDVLANSAATLARRLREHPSVFTFQWSDNNPTDEQEALTLQAFREEDFDVPVLASAEYKSSPQLGQAGEKEGPYDWVPPDYWYDREHSDYADDSSLSNVGGSWALDSEQSAGHTIPTRDSLDRFLSPADEAKLWQDPKANQYHANPETGTSGYNFGTLYNFDTALRKRYGPWSGLNGYIAEAQLQNYEDVRAQFEAFLAHSTKRAAPATGTIYWMANKGWPTLLWDLYNYDYDQAGSYFGAQEANRSLHALFATDDHTVAVDNLTGARVAGLDVDARVWSTGGTLLDERHSTAFALDAQQVRTHVLAPRVPAATGPAAKASTYFVELVLRRDGRVVDRNTYWESTRPDVVDWPATEGNPQATMTQYADLTALRDLAPASVQVHARTVRAGSRVRTVVTLTDTGRTAAFFLRADVRRGSAAGTPAGGDDEVRPATWTANDVTLWPGESETLTASYAAADLAGATPVVTVSGWNVAGTHTAAS